MGKTFNNQGMITNGGIFMQGASVMNMNTGGDQTITNYHGNVDNSHGKNNGDGTYTVKYRLGAGERDLDDWREYAEQLEAKVDALEKKISEPIEDKIGDLFVRLLKAIANGIAKKFGM
jgi:hypothetical protein